MFKKLALPAVAMLAIVACDGAGTPPATDTGLDLEDRKQRGSYAQGYMLGQQGKGLPIDQDAFVQGVRDGLTDAGKLAHDQLQAAVMDLQGLIAEGRVAEGAENRRAGEAFLAENAAREGVQVTASGLQYEVIAPGDGPRPTSSDTVTVHYRGTLIDGTEFDSSYSRNEPATFPLQGVIPGWTEALQLMPVGSTYKLCIPADLAYGDQVRPGGPIPPGSTLIFEVQLLGIEGQ